MSADRFEKPQVFGVKHTQEHERMASQSGGAFALLSDFILNQKGIIYGCAFDRSFKAVHIRADNSVERDRMRYSKYVQSEIGDIYRKVLEDLEKGETVLFSGTSCQVAGVLSYLSQFQKKIKGEFYSVDIVCHGVPSPRVWQDFLEWECEKKKSGIEAVICRNKKKYGWKSHIVTTHFSNGKRYDSKVFPRIFYSHVALRPGCYRCPYKSINHPSDITIADFWGVEKALPDYKDNIGVSLVLINTTRGKDLFESCKDNMDFKEARLESCMQKPLIEPYNIPANRENFWKDYERDSFDLIAKKYGDYSFYKDCLWKAKSFIKRKVLNK